MSGGDELVVFPPSSVAGLAAIENRLGGPEVVAQDDEQDETDTGTSVS